MSGLPISGIVDVNINAAAATGSITLGCNRGLIIGTSTVIGAEERVRSYNSLTEVAVDFAVLLPEYLAAQAYFSQNPKPKMVYIGLHDVSPETVAQAATACLAKVADWYGVYVCGASDADVTTIVPIVEAYGKGIVFFETTNADALNASKSDDAFSVLKIAGRKRVLGIYTSEVASYAGAALMGVAMGHETGGVGSAFSLSYLTMSGVVSEVVTSANYNALIAKNGNIFALRGQNYQLLHMGRLADGTPYDDLMYLDMTQNMIEAGVMGVIASGQTKIPQTDAGMAIILSAVNNALETMRGIGYLAEGVWTGQAVKELQPGDVVPGGFVIFVDSFSTMSAVDRAARKSPPITVALKTSGTIESVVINVNVNL